jgi:uncharacterized phage-associated protein
MAFDVRAVANYLLDKSDSDGITVDHMKLQKLVYIAHGWHLAVTGLPLFSNRIEAWTYGPVIPDLYGELKNWGHKPISHYRIERPGQDDEDHVWVMLDPDPTRMTESGVVLDQVWIGYGRLAALQLSSLTHQEGTPWDIARKKAAPLTRHVNIPNELIRKHYLELAARNRAKRT